MSNLLDANAVKVILKSALSLAKQESMDLGLHEVFERLEADIVEPFKCSFFEENSYDSVCANKMSTRELWVVYNDEISGYKIVYDEMVEAFGLAIIGSDGLERYLGVNGSLLYVYEAM